MLADRIRHVRLALAAPLGGFISLARFGGIVAREQGRASAFEASTAKRWEEGAEPDLSTIAALSRLARRHGLAYATRTWLAWGDEGVQEARDGPPAPHFEPRRDEGDDEGDGSAVGPVPPVAPKEPATGRRGTTRPTRRRA